MYSLLLLIGIVVCAICDMAITGMFTWSLIPISSIVLAWLVFFPVIKSGGKGLWGALLALSVAVVPYFYILSSLIETDGLLLPIGVQVSVISVLFLWIVYALFKILKSRKLVASAITLLLVIPMHLLISYRLSKLISEPVFDVWDLLSYSTLGITAIVLFILHFNARKKVPR